ncbi:hypothetical protein SAMN04487898_12283 [Pedobacter sp. ok626]|uniref:hypothetical protein n=1 Tax=Pedobacter sp. ok626 TaxID=1761882 RepID=UPI00088B7BB9|nr:hypothetical protein [Pedobacter sp. ok626]SDL67352.1 hypothetical protein SAMN04487898_12283 [Pedobacter sp. ok626]
MSVYLVTYDLNKKDKNYDGVITEIERSSAFCKPLKSTWLVSTTESAIGLHNRIWKHMDDNDYLLIIEVKANYYGWLEKTHWEWIKKHLG